ncbi:hypothetical protein ACJX0J_025311, partial [Zea mays]
MIFKRVKNMVQHIATINVYEHVKPDAGIGYIHKPFLLVLSLRAIKFGTGTDKHMENTNLFLLHTNDVALTKHMSCGTQNVEAWQEGTATVGNDLIMILAFRPHETNCNLPSKKKPDMPQGKILRGSWF